MARVWFRWALFFIGMILLPVSFLTYRSVQSLQDERESVLEEQRQMARLLQELFERLIGDITQDLAYVELSPSELGICERTAGFGPCGRRSQGITRCDRMETYQHEVSTGDEAHT